MTPTVLGPFNRPAPTYITAITPATAGMSHLRFFEYIEERDEELGDEGFPPVAP